MKTNRIAVVCNYKLLPERVGGMDYFFWDFDQRCKDNNVDIDWFFPNFSEHGKYSNLSIYSKEDVSVEKYFLDFCKHSDTKYSHVITHFVELCTSFFYKIKKFSTARIIVVDHNSRPINGYPLKKKINKRLKGILFSKYIDVFVGVSNYTVNAILKDFGSHLRSKTITIYNGVIIDMILIHENRKKNRPDFLVVSHLTQAKGIQDLIKAISFLPDHIKQEIKIDIYGDGPYKQNLVDKIEEFGLKDVFKFMGNKSSLNEIYYKYDYMLLPTHMECFNLSILESLAANVPVITTKVGGNIEVIIHEKNGYLFEAKDVKTLSNIIENVYLGHKYIYIDTRELIANSFFLQKMVENHFKLLYNTQI